MSDQKMIDTGIKAVKESLRNSNSIPFSSIRSLARKMIFENKLGDSIWLTDQIAAEESQIQRKRSLAKNNGFAPFTNMGLKAHQKIQEDYAPWILPIMAERLKSTEDIFGSWAVQFADAMDALGQSACSSANDLFSFVTSSRAWSEAKQVREDFEKENKPKKNNKKKKTGQGNISADKFQSNLALSSPEGTPIPAKIEVTLKIKELPNAGTNSDKLKFFTVMQNDKYVHVTVKPKAFKKISDASEKFPEWVAAISGEAGKISDNRIVLEKPNIQVFERKPKAQKMPEKSTQN